LKREELARVPGIGAKCIERLGAATDGSAPVTTVSELIGVYVGMRLSGGHLDSAEQEFFAWLKEVKLIKNNRHEIVRAISERAEFMVPAVHES
jgi:hypothetical protein